MRGVPLIATSPVRHESPIQVNPLEVQTYQPPWKALADYALQPDIDPNAPHFQQLVSQVRFALLLLFNINSNKIIIIQERKAAPLYHKLNYNIVLHSLLREAIYSNSHQEFYFHIHSTCFTVHLLLQSKYKLVLPLTLHSNQKNSMHTNSLYL